MINFIFMVQGVLNAAVGLYYLDILPYTSSNWGVMLNSAFLQGEYMNPQGYLTFLSPLVALTLLTLGLILLSIGLEEIFNPRLRTVLPPQEEEPLPKKFL